MTGNGQQLKRRPRLQVVHGLTPDGECLRSGYAYLIRSSVRMPELYPLLGELLFASQVDTGSGPESPPNVVGLFVEDSPDTLIAHLVGPDTDIIREQDITEKFCSKYMQHQTAAWLNTFGTFQQANSKLLQIGTEGNSWWRQSIAGPGNPMAILRFFRLAQEQPGRGAMNVFLLSSLSNLYRNLGLAEAAAFLKTMLNESIWAVDPEPSPVAGKTQLRGIAGLFFAVLQEGVLKPNEASYLESFFDGIIQVRPCILDNTQRAALVRVQALPEITEKSPDFAYLPRWQFQDGHDQGSVPDDWPQRRKFIYARIADHRIADAEETKEGQWPAKRT